MSPFLAIPKLWFEIKSFFHCRLPLKGGGQGHFHNAFLAPILKLGDIETQNNFFKIFEIQSGDNKL